MAFNNKNLAVLAYANGFTLWQYKTADAAASVETEGYFNDASEALRVGDFVIANTDNETTPKGAVLNVSSNSSGVVAMANIVSAAE
ncbi:MAG: hypothetical protein AB7U85_02110 [Alphaproteobacteria bacterium]